MDTPLDASSLVARVERGETFSYRFFWGHRPRKDGRLSDSCFSQWWACRFEVDKEIYTSAEQWMMASKARMFGDAQALARILESTDPDSVKAHGRRVQGFDEERWRAACVELVVAGNLAKFGQDKRLGKYLLSTGDDVLVEASPMDTIWGVGLSRDAPDVSDPRRWRGENLLGFAVMKVRAILRGELARL